MAVYVAEALRTFYHDVWRRALSGGSNYWCQVTTHHPGTPGAVALIPRGDAPEPALPWPLLPQEPAPGQARVAGWEPTCDKMQDAFTAVLRPRWRHIRLDDDVRHALRLAERHARASELQLGHADLILQVAVFGDIAYA